MCYNLARDCNHNNIMTSNVNFAHLNYFIPDDEVSMD